MGYTSIWISDHLLLPSAVDSRYPHTGDGSVPFSTESMWPEPIIALSWLASRLAPHVQLGTSVLVAPLRNPIILAKQLTTLSWLSGRGFSLGVGSGWLRDDYDAVGVDFEHRATVASAVLGRLRELTETGESSFLVGPAGSQTPKRLSMRPRAAGPIEFLWGGHSRVAFRLMARHCDGWLPTKHSVDQLREGMDSLRRQCDEVGRDFSSLRIVVKPGPGPTPAEGAITGENLETYHRMGISQAILEMPLENTSVAECKQVLATVMRGL